MVLLLMAVTVSSLSLISLQTQVDLKRSSAMMRERQAREYALAVERYAALYLHFDAFSSQIDHYQEF